MSLVAGVDAAAARPFEAVQQQRVAFSLPSWGLTDAASAVRGAALDPGACVALRRRQGLQLRNWVGNHWYLSALSVSGYRQFGAPAAGRSLMALPTAS